jgi:hypothetical protein
MYSATSMSFGDFDETRRHPDKSKSVFKDMKANTEDSKRQLEQNRDKVMIKDSEVTKGPSNINPKFKTSCHSKFFKKMDNATVRMSFQEFLKYNELNKEWKADLLDTHYKLGEKDEQINSTHRQFMNAKKSEAWLHKIADEDEEEQLRAYYKRRNESQNFTIKSDVNTDEFGPFETLKNRLLLTPRAKSKGLDGFEPMTSIKFTKTNFKVITLVLT